MARPQCRACVILPARNEEEALPATLDALASQTDSERTPLADGTFEILLLLNNCTDESLSVAQTWKHEHPLIDLHIFERTFCKAEAHVGSARRLLMDTAWHRLRGAQHAICGILSSDTDTEVASDWVWQNLRALETGADAVGGAIHLRDGDASSLPAGARSAYFHDRHYQRLIAELEDLLDPQPGDPWPRHLQHFGASLACTPQAYASAGGMPVVTPLEDVAFVDALRRCDARLRHDPAVMVYTSSRMNGRVDVGLSGQLREWQTMSDEGRQHRVPSAAWLVHRFRMLKALRLFVLDGRADGFVDADQLWRTRLTEARKDACSIADFLLRVDCNRLIEEMFHGERDGPIDQVNRDLMQALQSARESRPLSNG